jgi:uncharacterized membrane protein YdjX (TVP38/TMEM64 family)
MRAAVARGADGERLVRRRLGRGALRHEACTSTGCVPNIGFAGLEPSVVIDALGAWAPVAAVFAALACGLFCFPLTIVAVAAGVVFGPREGLLVAGAAVLASGLANFVVARHLWRGSIETRLRRYPRIARLDAVLGDGGGKVLALLRLSPLVPWAPVSYAAGLSRIRPRTYAWTCLAMLPLAMTYAWIGAMAGEVGAVAWDRIAADVEPWALPIGGSLILVAGAVAAQVVRTSGGTFLARKDAMR